MDFKWERTGFIILKDDSDFSLQQMCEGANT